MIKSRNYIALISLSFLLCWVIPVSVGQQNPFDLRYKLEESNDQGKKSIDSMITIDLIESPNIVNPPVVKQKHPTSAEDTSNTDTLISDLVRSEQGKEDIHSNKKGSNSLFFFLILIASVLLTTLAISSNKSLANNILRAVLNDNYLNLMFREQRRNRSAHYYILYFVFIVNTGLFLYFVLPRWLLTEDIPLLWRCILLIAIIYSVRYIFMEYLSKVYPFKKELGQYTFTILIFNILLGMILLPINVFLAFSPDSVANVFMYIGLSLLVIIFVFRQLRGFFISSGLFIHNKFYFLLYLCAVEIAPIAILFKYAGAFIG